MLTVRSKLIIAVYLSPYIILLILEFFPAQLTMLSYGLDLNVTQLLANLLTKPSVFYCLPIVSCNLVSIKSFLLLLYYYHHQPTPINLSRGTHDYDHQPTPINLSRGTHDYDHKPTPINLSRGTHDYDHQPTPINLSRGTHDYDH